MLELQPITQKEANAFITLHHRHHPPSRGYKFAIAVNDGAKVVGVITTGRPVAASFDDGWTAEITRCCTDGTRNAPSILYGAAIRAALAMGYRRVVTYTMRSEGGAPFERAASASWRLAPPGLGPRNPADPGSTEARLRNERSGPSTLQTARAAEHVTPPRPFAGPRLKGANSKSEP